MGRVGQPGGRIPKDGFAAGRPDGIYLTPRGKKRGVIKETVRDKHVIHSESLPDGQYHVFHKYKWRGQEESVWRREYIDGGRLAMSAPLTWKSRAEYFEFLAEKWEAGKWDDLNPIPDDQREAFRQEAARLRAEAASLRASPEPK
jgi:hypothetical protein